MREFIPTDEQTEFIEAVQVLIECKIGIMGLDAPAGTGKSSVIKYIRSINKSKNILVLAPTHKACSLFDFPVITIHKFLNAEKNIDDDGEIFFDFKIPIIDKIDLIIIDEASMVSELMYSTFKKLSESVPILFCGDKSQIPPVEESTSIIFQEVKCSTFTKNMRSRDSLSNHWLKKFKDAISNDSIIRVDKTPSIVVYNSFKNKEDSIVLAWTNRQVSHWNNIIRKNLFFTKDNTNALKKYYENEKLVFSGYRNTLNQKEALNKPWFQNLNLKVNFKLVDSNDSPIKYYSSDMFTIKKIETQEVFIPFFRCQHQVDSLKLRKCIACNIKGHNTLGHDINFYVLTDDNGITWLKAFDKEQEELVNSILLDLRNHCKHIKEKQLWKTYYDIKEIINPNINYIYASTIHKAQGSQWSNVFVDIDNIRFCRDHSLSSRLQYTAVSRMINEILFV